MRQHNCQRSEKDKAEGVSVHCVLRSKFRGSVAIFVCGGTFVLGQQERASRPAPAFVHPHPQRRSRLRCLLDTDTTVAIRGEPSMMQLARLATEKRQEKAAVSIPESSCLLSRSMFGGRRICTFDMSLKHVCRPYYRHVCPPPPTVLFVAHNSQKASDGCRNRTCEIGYSPNARQSNIILLPAPPCFFVVCPRVQTHLASVAGLLPLRRNWLLNHLRSNDYN